MRGTKPRGGAQAQPDFIPKVPRANDPRGIDYDGSHQLGAVIERDGSRGRAGTCCANCGKRLDPQTKRAGRPQRFCSDKCRDEARRARNFAAFGATRRGRSRKPRNVQNNHAASKACRSNSGDRASGVCGPVRVISRELFAGLTWRAVISPDDVRAEVARLGEGAVP